MRRTPRGSEKRMKRKKRGAETSDAMRRAPSDSENREMMRGISKKLRRSRRKVEKLEITLLSLNAGRKSQARKRGEDTRQRSRTKKLGIYARQESRTREPDKGAGLKSKVTTYNDRQQEGSGACGASQDHLGNSR